MAVVWAVAGFRPIRCGFFCQVFCRLGLVLGMRWPGRIMYSRLPGVFGLCCSGWRCRGGWRDGLGWAMVLRWLARDCIFLARASPQGGGGSHGLFSGRYQENLRRGCADEYDEQSA